MPTAVRTQPTSTDPGTSRRRNGRRLVAGLLALSAVPMLAGSARLAELASRPEVTDANRRFVDSPLPVVVHVIGAIVFSVAGAFQFSPALRRRGSRWHRRAGRIVAPAGIVAAMSGLWMTFAYDLPATDTALLGVFRVAAGVAMFGSLVAALAAVRARRFGAHGAWMARAYAIGLGAGTQVFTHVAWTAAAGKPTPFERSWLMFAGWAINVTVVEYALRRRPTTKPYPAVTTPG